VHSKPYNRICEIERGPLSSRAGPVGEKKESFLMEGLIGGLEEEKKGGGKRSQRTPALKL